ncbi:phosphoesterase [Methanothermobacter sp. CaT2]|uniref:metallophosphoesterase n=1 Tax=unclassified Methanothermobacter TaxID=2631116 RepID=UPI0002CCFD80|nr:MULTISPECIES: metallophosphoesterase [unclassified Methanothermobacter]BAM70968.1 phosphoesterase [Methanothermobacter sp. CaT2]
MKILAVSDLHGSNIPELHRFIMDNRVDLIVVAGDITHFGPAELVEELLNDLASHNIPVVAVPGNCDPHGAVTKIENSKAVNIHGRSINIKDIAICGLGGSNPTPFNTPLELEEDEIKAELDDLMEKSGEGDVLILVTHAPPHGTSLDRIPSGDNVGSRGVRDVIERHQPCLNICGHIHESPGVDRIGETIVVNPGQLSDGRAALIEIEDDGSITAEILNLRSS